MPVLKTLKDGVWVPVSGISEHTHTKEDIIDLQNENQIYVQNEEPMDTQDGTLWIDTDEECADINCKSAYDYAVEAGYEGTEEEFARQMANPYSTAITDDGEGNVVITSLVTLTASDDGQGNVVLT